MDAFGGIDILINNAGIALPKAIDDLTEADWDETVDTNLKSAFLITQAILPQMRERRWGRLIFLSSVAAQVGGVIGPHYAASKAGMHGMMHYYAAHLAKEGITSNVIAPALIRTEMVTNNPRAKPELIPVGHFGEPEDISSVVLLLVQNGYITGQTISVNGGWYLT
jgi:3-oxoacyl-[acyl-carrier protein] reductase